jgi:dephospho-CoA kinase
MFQGKPIIGLVGGIGSGKSFVASLFAELGCAVISADELVTRAYDDPVVQDTIAGWWGDSVVHADGSVDRAAIADRVFRSEADRLRLEGLLHPIVNAQRERAMNALAGDPAVRAYVWDIPLLVETGQDRLCDTVVFIDAPMQIRQQRVAAARGWESGEIERREKMQAPLDKKRAISQYSLINAADAGSTRKQVVDIFSRILTTCRPG